jgi:type II secretory pathway pseudopilin PulG
MEARLTSFCRGKVVRPKAYSIIEFIGVLAVLAILAAALLPVFIKHVDIAAVNTETGTLNSISNAIVLQVLRNDQIPSEATWSNAAANWLPLPLNNIAYNSRNYARAFVIDTSGWFNTNLPTSGYYNQTNGGTSVPTSPLMRMMVVSSLSANLPSGLTSRPGSAIFNDLWNTGPGNLPANPIWNGWSGRGDDLLVQRINLQPLFDQLILVNRDQNSTNATFAINNSSTLTVTNGSPRDAWYIGGSVVGLSSNSLVLQTSYVLNRNISYVFENGTWGGQIADGLSTYINTSPGIASNYNYYSTLFLQAADSPDNSGNNEAAGDQEQVLAAMNDIMMVYTLWAGENFTTHGMTTGQAFQAGHLSIANYLNDSVTYLDQAAGTSRNINVNKPPVYSGLLY